MIQPPTWKEVFTFNRRERTSIIILLLLVVSAHYSYSYYKSNIAHELAIEYDINDDPEINPTNKSDSKEYSHHNNESKESKRTAEISPINLNEATAEELKTISGIGPVLSARIVKYRDVKGGYESLNELREVYGLTAETYESVKPYLFVPAVPKPIHKETSKENAPPKNSDNLRVDINTANAATLDLLPYISPKMATAIVNYRNAIGGFDSISQLLEVYVINPETYDRIYPNLSMTAKPKEVRPTNENPKTPIHKPSYDDDFVLDLNSASAEEIQKIRGIGPSYSDRIIKLKEGLGGYHSIHQLKKVYGMNDTLYQSIAKHFKIEAPHQTFIIDTISFKNLLRKKILTYDEVKYVFNLKKAKKSPILMEDLRRLQGIDSDHLEELAPYLLFSDQ